MSSIVRAVTGEMRAEYGLFAIAGVVEGCLDSSALLELEPPDGPADRFAAGRDGLIIQTAHLRNLHEIHGRIERWDGPPSIDPWEELWTGRLFVGPELVGVAAWTAGHSLALKFDLGQGETTWTARVATKILQTEEEVDFPQAIAQVELFKIQLWT
ncbi:hypothetical protein HII36_06495 [Nonomuraea sp. NN258]|uniref:hypothetical protein n=1 Tax=Nonomuraea antri TaxID=2730852 RepID=UPI001568FF78|nr:hypothetical protein [Nonomuraea antri]NRQ31490.1 hypothetical protein [Nonomuraea antri]